MGLKVLGEAFSVDGLTDTYAMGSETAGAGVASHSTWKHKEQPQNKGLVMRHSSPLTTICFESVLGYNCSLLAGSGFRRPGWHLWQAAQGGHGWQEQRSTG